MKKKIHNPITIKEHEYVRVRTYSQGFAYMTGVSGLTECKHCGVEYGSLESIHDCKARTIEDPLHGLTAEEHSFFTQLHSFNWDEVAGKWWDRVTQTHHTLKEMKKRFSKVPVRGLSEA